MQTFDNFTRGIPSTRIPKPVDKIEDPIQRETPKGRKIRPNFTHLTNDSMLCI